MAKNMVESDKPRSLIDVLAQAAKKAAEALTEKKKRTPPPSKPETVFVAKSGPPEKTKIAESKSPSKPDTQKVEPVIPREKLEAIKAIIGEAPAPEVVVREAAKANPQFAAALGGKPVTDEVFQEILATGVTEGKTLIEIAQDVQGAVRARKIKTSEGALFTNRVASLTRSYEVLVEASGAAGWTFFDEANPGAVKSPEVKEKLEKIQRAINRDPNLTNDDKWLARQAEKLAESDLPDSEIKDSIDRLRQQQRDVINVKSLAEQQRRVQEEAVRYAEHRRAYSQFQLSLEEESSLIGNPEDAVERWMRNFYQWPAFPGGSESGAQHRVSMYLGFLESQDYMDQYFQKRNIQTPSEDDLRSFHELKKHIKEYVETQTSLKFAAAAAEQGVKFDTVVNYLSQAGERAWHRVAIANKGMNMVGYNLFEQELEAIRFAKNDETRRVTSDLLFQAKQRVIDEIVTNKAIYEEIYGKKINREDAEHFANVGQVLAKVRQKTVVALLKGLGAAESIQGGPIFDGINFWANSYADSSSDEAIAASMDWVRFFSEKWGNLSPGQQRIAEFVFEFAAIDVGYDKEVDRDLILLRQNRAGYIAARDKAVIARWGENSQDRKLKKWKDTAHEPMNWDKEYRRILLSEKGRRVFGELLEMYDHDSSGWRGEQVLQQVHALWENSDTIALGFWLRRAAAPFIDARQEEAEHIFDHGAKKEYDGRVGRMGNDPVMLWGANPDHEDYGLSVFKVLKKVAAYRPQAIGLMLREQKNAAFSEWWQSNETQAAARSFLQLDPNQEISGFAEVYRRIQHRFSPINEFIARRGLPSIDYNLGIDGIPQAQRQDVKAIISNVLAKTGDDRGDEAVEAYMDFMKRLSAITGQDAQINEFKGPMYRSYLKRTQWTDDARFALLETPKTLQGPTVRATASERLPFSYYTTYEGMGRRGPLARTWGDLLMGLELIPVVRDALTADKKQLFEMLKAIRTKEDIYAGAPNAIRAITYIDAGWGKTAMTDPGLAELFVLGGMLPNSSEMRRYFGDDAPSFTKNDLDSLIDQQEFLNSKLKLYPDLAETVSKLEQYFGLSWKVGRAELRLPLYAHRTEMFMGVVALLLMAEGSKILDTALGGSGGSVHPS